MLGRGSLRNTGMKCHANVGFHLSIQAATYTSSLSNWLRRVIRGCADPYCIAAKMLCSSVQKWVTLEG